MHVYSERERIDEMCLLGLLFLDLPMGLGKFEGDDKLPEEKSVEAQIEAIEGCNKAINSIFVVICHHLQQALVSRVLKQFGYKDQQPMVFHKAYKADKAPQGGFVSAVLFAVVGFKDRSAVFREASVPETMPERLSWMQNMWVLPRATPAVLDDEGRAVNECPQDPLIPQRFIQMFRAALGPKLVVFSGGESSG
jgi:hypothetical protein